MRPEMEAKCVSVGDVVVRKSSSFLPTIWGEYFIQDGQHHASSSTKSNSGMKERIEELKEQVRSMFKDAVDDVLQTMALVDSIQLLGLAYHFEKEIDEALIRTYDAVVVDFELYETALRFRLLREHGYHVSPSVFNKFKDEEWGFISTLKDDAKGLLSLYNAAYLGTCGEMVLDEAIPFARSQLLSLLSDLQNPLAKQVILDLETPLCRRMRRLLARKYIPIYEEDTTRDDAILELAKLDFNLLQSFHREELKKISLWWRNLALAKTLSFVRDRVVESYYWILGIYFEPQYSRARIIATKVIALISIMDDIYDNYSTLEESQLLTEAIDRWELETVDTLPLYMKDFYLKLINNFEEIKNELAVEEKYRVLYLIEEMKALSKAYYEEARWGVERYVPTVEEHLRLSIITSTGRMLACNFFVGMGEEATKEAFEWVGSFPMIIKASCIIARVMDDINTHELEKERDYHVSTTVECYMKENNTDVKEACKKLQILIDNAWKDSNKERLRPMPIPRPLLERVINFSRSMEDIHKYIDSYTHATTTMKDHISLLFVHPIPI